MKAHGLAILTVAKIGFLVTARGGSGIVIAKLPGGGKMVDFFILLVNLYLLKGSVILTDT